MMSIVSCCERPGVAELSKYVGFCRSKVDENNSEASVSFRFTRRSTIGGGDVVVQFLSPTTTTKSSGSLFNCENDDDDDDDIFLWDFLNVWNLLILKQRFHPPILFYVAVVMCWLW